MGTRRDHDIDRIPVETDLQAAERSSGGYLRPEDASPQPAPRIRDEGAGGVLPVAREELVGQREVEVREEGAGGVLPVTREELVGKREVEVREEGAGGVLPVAREELVVGKREVEGATTKVDVVTHHRDVAIDEPISRTRVEVERVPVDRFVETAPEVRHEGDVMIVPVVEEVIVVERRLRLKEEVRVRTVVEQGRYRDTVELREQEAVVRRTG